MMESLNRKVAYLRQKRTRVIGLVVVLIVLPDWIARGQFWYGAAAWGWPFLRAFYNSEVGRLLLTMTGIVLIFVPWDRGGGKVREYDLATLKGRTLKLRDGMQAYLDSLPAPKFNKFEGETIEGYLKRVSTPASLRVSKLFHGYELRFADEVGRLFHEYGVRGITDLKLADAMNRPYQTADTYPIIIESLSRLAEKAEAEPEILPDVEPEQI